MSWSVQIKSYTLTIAGHQNAHPGGWRRFISLSDETNRRRAIIQFMDDDRGIPNASEHDIGDGDKMVSIYMHKHDYLDVVDILRNEKPVYLTYYSPTAVRISTSSEPIGEEEFNEE